MIQNISAELTVDAAADLASARGLLRSTVSFDLFLLDINLDTYDCEDIDGINYKISCSDILSRQFQEECA